MSLYFPSPLASCGVVVSRRDIIGDAFLEDVVACMASGTKLSRLGSPENVLMVMMIAVCLFDYCRLLRPMKRPAV
jgi:hypothetical protein